MQLITTYPWYYFLVCLLVGILYAVFLYYQDKKNQDRSKNFIIALASLRFVSVSIISFLLLELFMKHIITETEKPVIIIAQDNSSSIISGKDSSFIKTEYNQALTSFINAVKETYEVKTYQFDNSSKQSDTYDFKGNETDISNVFLDIENNFSNQNIGAVVLATDGIYNKGSNPLYSITNINAPVYTIALGDTTVLKDAFIQSVNHNQIAYLGNVFPVEVVVNAIDLKDKQSTISISQNGKLIKQETLFINASNFSKTYNFTLEALSSGIQKYTVTITALDEEKNKQNNSQSFLVEVIDNREKILILANAPHPDIAAIEQSLASSQTYEVEVSLVDKFTKPLKPYSLVILHHTANLPTRILSELKANNQSIWFIGLNSPSGINGINVHGNGNRFNDIEPIVQPNFALFTVSPELKNYLKELPAVVCNFGNSTISNGANSLINQRIGVVNTDNPLFYFTEQNAVKMATFAGDGLWRWRMRDYADHTNFNLFNELISKTVQYLSVKADKSFFRVFTKKIINENEALDFTAEVYNQSYELVTEPDVTLTLKDDNNKSYNYSFSKKQTMYSLSAGQFPAGEYRYEAKVKYANNLYTKTGLVIIKEVIAEKNNTVANHQLLYQIAKQSGGQLFYKNQLKELQQSILANNTITAVTYSHKQLTDLINLKWLFFLIVGLLSLEWFLRKYNGRV